MRERHFLALTTIIAGLFSIVSSCYGELVIVQFTAEVTETDDPYYLLQGIINLGDTITGTYTYDTSAPDIYSDTWWARYEYDTPPSGISVRVDGFESRSDPDNTDFSIEIVNNAHAMGGSWDSFVLESENNLPFGSDLVIYELSLHFIDDSALAISSDALPVDAPEIAMWSQAQVWIRGGARQRSVAITGDLASAVLIPEPATLGLLGFGGLVILTKRRGDEAVISTNQRSKSYEYSESMSLGNCVYNAVLCSLLFTGHYLGF
ncbi:MAG: PEP-CTERM sorting domain-containing protein [Sedimentisphaerales bacterium]|nr:PEP-CTERM sorting domain-containing protein [Sedimentisphaerales bacterium]